MPLRSLITDFSPPHFFLEFCKACENQSLVGGAAERESREDGRLGCAERSPGAERRFSRSGLAFIDKAMRLRLRSTSTTVT